jgi:hypothetical protein
MKFSLVKPTLPWAHANSPRAALVEVAVDASEKNYVEVSGIVSSAVELAAQGDDRLAVFALDCKDPVAGRTVTAAIELGADEADENSAILAIGTRLLITGCLSGHAVRAQQLAVVEGN